MATLLAAALLAVPACGDRTGIESQIPRPSRLVPGAGDNQRGVVGQALTDSLVVKLVDQYGRPMPGWEVRWSVTSGGGTMSPAVSRTGRDGTARTQWTLGTRVDVGHEGAASHGSLEGASFRATADAGAVFRVYVTPADASMTALGDTLRLVASAADQFGNPVSVAAFAWSADSSRVVAVGDDGRAVSRGNGTAVVSATTAGMAGTARVTVRQLPVELRISALDERVSPADTMHLRAAAVDRNGHEVAGASTIWRVSDPAVARVDAAGVVTGRCVGTTSAVAESGNLSGTVRIVVPQQIAAKSTRTDGPYAEGIIVVDADGRRRQVLTSGSGAVRHQYAAWMPDGRRFTVVLRSIDLISTSYYTYGTDGSEETRLFGRTGLGLGLNWSPGGDGLAFDFSDDPPSNRWHIYVFSPSTGTVERLTHDVAARDQNPVWSPDGRSIAFVAGEEGSREIFLMNRDGGNRRRLPTAVGDAWGPAWSPAGDRIVFVAGGRTTATEMYSVAVDGSGVRRLPAGDGATGAAWSPDGYQIAFARDGRVHLMDPGGTAAAPVFEGWNPSWRPRCAADVP